MLQIIASALITPASLATPPPMAKAPEIRYDWTTQRSVELLADGEEGTPLQAKLPTVRSTQSYIGGNFISDDITSD